MNPEKIERREFKRFKVPPGEFFVYCHEIDRMAVIIDISMGGLKYEYSPANGNKFDSMLIDIFALPKERIYLAGIHCKVIYDIANLNEGSTFSGFKSRISGLKYKKLTDEQNDKLAYLINLVDK